MIGQQFGKLTVTKLVGTKPNGAGRTRAWSCICECGRTRIVAETELKRGRITACDRRRGVPRGIEYTSYAAMKARCYQPTHKDFHNYGGRGIQVCDRWVFGHKCATGFECFLEDMGSRPSPSHSIERMNSDGDYEPTNCRWATADEQAENRRITRRITVGGETLTLQAAAKRFGLKYSVLLNRLDRYGMTPEEAVRLPLYARRKSIVTASRER